MSDAQTKTLLLNSADRRASLRVNCNDHGKYVVLFTLPKGIPTTNPTMVEFRFDSETSAGYLIETVDIASLVVSLGGSRTDANYVIGTAGPESRLQNEQIVGAGQTLTSKMRSSSKLLYRLPLAPASAMGTEGSFNLRGFDKIERTVGWKCQ